jgi:hypothetical protein
MGVKDIFGREIKEGYFVVGSSDSGIHVGRVTNISKKAFITIDQSGEKYGKIVIPYGRHKFFIIDNPQEALPPNFLSLFVD